MCSKVKKLVTILSRSFLNCALSFSAVRARRNKIDGTISKLLSMKAFDF